jgi:hypothetical protein
MHVRKVCLLDRSAVLVILSFLDGMNMCRVSIEMLEMHFWHGSW